MTRMTHWVETIPAFVVLTVVLFLPGWLVVRALGSRGLEALAVSPAVSVGVIAVAATVAQRLGISWGLLTLAVVTLAAFAVAWGVGRLVGRLPERWAGADLPPVSPTRRLLGRPRPDVVGAIALGVLLALVTILPAIGRPDELVDSPDAVYHLNRIALFLDTGNFSIANPTFYPNGFHAWIATSLLPGVADVLPGTNVATVVLAAVVWPVGCVALVRHALGTSRLVTYAGGLASAAFVSFPTILLGWGVLWPNLMATALTPGALALMLQAARSRRVGQWLGFAAALPGPRAHPAQRPRRPRRLRPRLVRLGPGARRPAGPPGVVEGRPRPRPRRRSRRRRSAGRAGRVRPPGVDPVLRVEGPRLDLDRARRGRRWTPADPRRAVGPAAAHRARHRLDRPARPRCPAGRRDVAGLRRALCHGSLVHGVLDRA